MRTLVRWLVLIAVALAVPVQGMAAVGAGVCMAMGHHDAPEMHDHGEHADHGGHHEHDKQSGEAHCPPCVSCCAAAVISHAMTPSLPEAAPSAAIATSHRHVPGAPPARLDRPPLAL